MIAHLSEIKPQMATLLNGVQVIASIGVWAESIKGVAAVITMCLSVPIAVLSLVYWYYKVKEAIKNNKKEFIEDE
jgi:hypothetical protein